jgi:hypothetical protein
MGLTQPIFDMAVTSRMHIPNCFVMTRFIPNPLIAELNSGNNCRRSRRIIDRLRDLP